MEDYEITYEEFWKEIVENPDGSLNLDQVKRELQDYERLLGEVPKAYCHVTGGLISKPNTKAECVIEEFENYVEKRGDEQVLETIREIKEQVVWDVFSWLEDHMNDFGVKVGNVFCGWSLPRARETYLKLLKKEK